MYHLGVTVSSFVPNSDLGKNEIIIIISDQFPPCMVF